MRHFVCPLCSCCYRRLVRCQGNAGGRQALEIMCSKLQCSSKVASACGKRKLEFVLEFSTLPPSVLEMLSAAFEHHHAADGAARKHQTAPPGSPLSWCRVLQRRAAKPFEQPPMRVHCVFVASRSERSTLWSKAP